MLPLPINTLFIVVDIFTTRKSSKIGILHKLQNRIALLIQYTLEPTAIDRQHTSNINRVA